MHLYKRGREEDEHYVTAKKKEVTFERVMNTKIIPEFKFGHIGNQEILYISFPTDVEKICVEVIPLCCKTSWSF